MIKRQYLVSYQFDAAGTQGFGSMQISVTAPWWRRYTEKDLHRTRVIIAGVLRRLRNIGTNRRVSVVILNLVRFPL